MGACEGKAQDLSSELVVESDNGPGRLDMLYPEFMAQTSPFLPIQDFAELRVTCRQPSNTQAMSEIRKAHRLVRPRLISGAKAGHSAEQLAMQARRRPKFRPRRTITRGWYEYTDDYWWDWAGFLGLRECYTGK
eukprot:s9581_g2.t1